MTAPENTPMIETCDSCVHFNMFNTTCTAFPDGVPLVFLYGMEEHATPVPGDNGITHERISDEAGIKRLQEYLDWGKIPGDMQ